MHCAKWILAALLAAPVFAASCDSLASLALPNGTITMAQLISASQFSVPAERQAKGPNPYKELPEFCRVAATLKPSSDSDIKIEVWAPFERLEPQVASCREWRLGGGNRLFGHGRGGSRGLCKCSPRTPATRGAGERSL